MFEKILVPLDGSRLAECALPYAEELVKDRDAQEVILVSVTERISGRTRAPEVQELYLTGQEQGFQEAATTASVTFGKMQRQAQRYLGRIAKRLEAKDIKVRREVLLGNPAEQITNFAEGNAADLIVMSSHGRSGPSRWAYGSVADKVFRASCIPILLVRAPGCIPGI